MEEDINDKLLDLESETSYNGKIHKRQWTIIETSAW